MERKPTNVFGLYLVIAKQSNEVLRDGHVQNELTHHAICLTSLHIIIVAQVDWLNDVSVHEGIESSYGIRGARRRLRFYKSLGKPSSQKTFLPMGRLLGNIPKYSKQALRAWLSRVV